uniref:Uncharacterized protein n=1 Tax=Chromera velia CCMP2878 TaxID=1169474 RepID=A0A0G4G8F4_9ALVE|eukprot:Cvel_4321.t1-p1 / transcript=Cvel_4321.t1 / gene=Cvel_4321 / organism=Chromera_velia_CCMP2878 / gene_product=hypothetical protein / transcript_product=hypothetical protein / location=Cvel_scaffold187:64798-65169(-) / protein_length=124 / sequence_SO=supercontig / SO=protein_coding / is_pseudo=false
MDRSQREEKKRMVAPHETVRGDLQETGPQGGEMRGGRMWGSVVIDHRGEEGDDGAGSPIMSTSGIEWSAIDIPLLAQPKEDPERRQTSALFPTYELALRGGYHEEGVYPLENLGEEDQRTVTEA